MTHQFPVLIVSSSQFILGHIRLKQLFTLLDSYLDQILTYTNHILETGAVNKTRVGRNNKHRLKTNGSKHRTTKQNKQVEIIEND